MKFYISKLITLKHSKKDAIPAPKDKQLGVFNREITIEKRER
jgi:hypothetical protein